MLFHRFVAGNAGQVAYESSYRTEVGVPYFRGTFFVVLVRLYFFYRGGAYSSLGALYSRRGYHYGSSSVYGSSDYSRQSFGYVCGLQGRGRHYVLASISTYFYSFYRRDVYSAALRSLHRHCEDGCESRFSSNFLPRLCVFFQESYANHSGYCAFFSDRLYGFVYVEASRRGVSSGQLVYRFLYLASLFSSPLNQYAYYSSRSGSANV